MPVEVRPHPRERVHRDGVPQAEVRTPVQGARGLHEPLHIQLRGGQEQAPGKGEPVPYSHPCRDGFHSRRRQTRRGQIRHRADLLLPALRPLLPRDRAPRMHRRTSDDAPGHPVRGDVHPPEGGMQVREEHRYRSVRHLPPRLRVLLREPHQRGGEARTHVRSRVGDPLRRGHRKGRGREPQGTGDPPAHGFLRVHAVWRCREIGQKAPISRYPLPFSSPRSASDPLPSPPTAPSPCASWRTARNP